MDPVTAFSLACGVIQLVDFSLKTLHKSKELWEKGSLGSHDDLEDMTKRLGDLQIDLKPPQAQQTAFGSVSYQSEDELLQLVDKIKQTSDELLQELQNLKPKRKRDTVQVVVATMARKKKLDDLKDKLDSYRKILDTKVIVSLRQQLHQVLRDQQEDVKKLDQSLQTLIASFAANSSSFDRLAPLLREESKSIREHVTSEIQRMEKRTADTKFYEELLASLRFPEIHCREEEIRDAYTKTFSWIFEHAGDQTRPQPRFVEWLATGSKIFWIRGKAGSGKSTLMKYIWQHQETKTHLKNWANPARLIIPAYFFWTAGSSLQKTLIGLLRSLIYQILHNKPELVTCMKEETHPMGLPFLFGQTRDEIPSWTESRLRHCLVLLSENIPTDCRICLFIDGLDEFNGDHWTFVDFLMKLVENPAIKCCVSSRPEKPFDDLGSCAIVLKLEDYTRPDIEKYVRGKLSEVPRDRNSQISEREREYLVYRISRLADGVFLWVELVVSSHITMIRNGDDFGMLLSHLERLPREVEGLYCRMLERIDDAYREEAAKYIRYVKMYVDNAFHDMTVLDLAIAIFGLTDKMELVATPLDPKIIYTKCKRVKQRIRSTCSGILGLVESGSPRGRFLGGRPSHYDKSRVQFHHRSARDFFQEGSPGFQFLDRNSQTSVNQQLLPAAVYLGIATFYGPSISQGEVSTFVYAIFVELSRCIGNGGKVPFSYFDHIDRTVSKCASLFSWTTEKALHWCTCLPKWRVLANRNDWPDQQVMETIADTGYPEDFLSFAASWHFHDYVIDTIRSHRIPPSPEKLTKLLAFALFSQSDYSSHKMFDMDKSSDTREQHRLMISLVELGANIRSDKGQTIWQMVLGSIVEIVFGYGRSHKKVTNVVRMIRTFLDAGANPHPIVGVTRSYVPRSGRFSRVGFFIDTSVLTITDWIEGKGGLSKSLDCQNSESSLIDQRALRIWFQIKYGDEWWPTEGFVLSQEQAQGLHRFVKANLEVDSGTILTENDNGRDIAYRSFHDQVDEIFQACASTVGLELPDRPYDPDAHSF